MSGKTARKLRRLHPFPKKAIALCAGLCISAFPATADGEFLISVYPHFTKPFGQAHEMQYGIGGGVKATYRPIKYINLFAEGDYLSMAMPGIDPISIVQGGVGTGYHLDVTDRISFDLNLNVGIYNAKANKNVTGVSAGGSLVFSYKLNPSIYLDVGATANHFAAKSSPLMMVNAGAAPGLTFNITEMFNRSTNLGIDVESLSPVFPVLYSWYENNSFGKVNITNNEDTSISDVVISFYQPQYMAHSKECARIKKINRDETVSVDLVAFFNEQMLELTEKTDTSSYIIVNYSRLGKKLTQTYALDVPVYGRNNMSWDDDRRAAVFVSSKDPAAMQFGKYTASIVRDNLRVDIPVNIQYALGIFEVLNQFGINYVVDPSSAFEDNVGTSSIDFLQFPYQTLMYRGGDCDDLSILVCSLFEAVGIDTAFITVPGHIFMAFNAGISPEMAKTVFRNTSEFIFIDDEVWVPLEITLSDEGFYKACRYGAREWNSAAAQGTAALYKMRDSWQLYQPISVPGATAYFNMPESDAIALAFSNGMDQWSCGELKPVIANNSIMIAKLKESEDPENTKIVIKGNPLSDDSLKTVIALAGKNAVLPPSALRKEDVQDDSDAASGDGDGDGFGDDELIEDLIPLDFALATLQTDVPVSSASSQVELYGTFVTPEHSERDTELAMLEPDFTVTEPENTMGETGNKFIGHANPVAGTESTVVGTESTVVELVETTADLFPVSKSTAIPSTPQNGEIISELKPAAQSEKSTAGKNIIIISAITLSASLAAGIIIFGKIKKA